MKKMILNFILIFGFISFSDTILTTTNATYTLTNLLTKDMGVNVVSVFETATSMDTNQDIYFKKSEYALDRFNDIVAVVDLKNIWKNDLLYKYSRLSNIRTVEIDASTTYTDNSSLIMTLFKDNPYIWLDFTNAKKMLNIIHSDLVSLYPKSKKILDKNLYEALNEINNIENMYLDIYNIDGVIILNNSLAYLVSYLNIPYILVDDLSKLEKTIKETGFNTVLTNRYESKETKDLISKNKASLTYIKTGKMPVEDEDDEDLMSKSALTDIYLYNLKELKKLNNSKGE
ncbi:metal ABC transporter solute-binding protein, Zn/Mn family [Oceanivirga miroungae]|uniref:Periplasmic solute binding protein n=1 Tax=Oceanivirga miroungae TaxID=1130046 RepID=A0A6I8M769_9FUSO|nr:zinc ABC transporter substrate-binding protein [Oceanivirga miroungae]VWL85714.1 hypothetical protein OMES3154_01002 [Oceanivirga miroungae]